MIRRILFSVVAVLAGTGIAQAADKDDVQAAIQKLTDADNYSWTTTTTGGFGGGTSTGMTQKDGLTSVTLSMRQTDYPTIIEGKKAVVKTDTGWSTIAELTADDGGGGGGFNPSRFIAMQVQNFATPAAQAKAIVDQLPAVQKTDDAYTATLSDDQATALLNNRRRPTTQAATTQPDGTAAPAMPAFTVTNPKGTVSVWIKDGIVTKMELHVTGTVSFNGNDNDVDRTITTEIKDVGTTKIDIPPDAKAKLDATTMPAN